MRSINLLNVANNGFGIYVPNLRFPWFTEEWEAKKLADINIINPKNENLPFSFIYIDLESVVNGRLLKEERILKDEAPSRAQRRLTKGDILFQMVRPYQKNNLYFDKAGDYVASTGYAQIRTLQNSQFVFQYLHNQKFVDKVIERCTGTSYPAINSSDLGNIKIHYPNSREQNKIANFLELLDNRIQTQNKIIEELTVLKTNLAKKIFSCQLRFKNENNFPKWENQMLGDIGQVVTGKTPSTKDLNLWDGNIQFVTPTDISKNKYQYLTERTVKKTENLKILPPKSIMFTCIASIGKMSLSLKPCVTNQQINSIIPNSDFNNEFIFYAVANISEFIKSTQSSSTMPIINKTEFSKFKISVPSIEEQTKIANFLSQIDEKIETEKAILVHLENQKKYLLQNMFV